MMNSRRLTRWLVSSTALAVVMGATEVTAQTISAGGDASALEEVVVTATRQADTVNRVPLSVTAVTQRALDQQGVKTAQDLSRTVPALRITSNTTNGASISIRGIASSTGAATTGVYLDDTPLQKRGGQGAVNGIGIVFPQLFDLERVEVLRGPQGTLFGGSSEGGTVRFITPTPSLTRRSAALRLEGANTEHGSGSYEAGAAFGGPLVADKLGFRVSGLYRHTGGYIDHVSRFTGRTLAKDTNDRDVQSVRLAVLWRPTERLSITPAYYYSREDSDDVDTFWENVPAYTQAERYYTASGAATTATSPTRVFTYPAHNYPALNFYGPYKSGTNQCVYADALASPTNDQCVAYQPKTDILSIPSLTAEYNFDHVSVRSISSMIIDSNKGKQPMFSASLGTANNGNEFVFNLPYVDQQYYYSSKRRGLTQELRFSSANPDSRFSWVAGGFFSNFNTQSYARDIENADLYNLILKGVALPAANHFPGQPDFYAYRDQHLKEREVAVFGEGNFLVTSKLKATVGLRYAKERFAYEQRAGGPAQGFLIGTEANGGFVRGRQEDKPVTPKFGLSYQFTSSDLAYVTVAKGYRGGGVNAPAPGSNGNTTGRCYADLQTLGLTETPTSFNSDSVWSYEAGAKLRVLGGRAQINSSLFYIDWKDPQTNFGLPTCGFSYVINAGRATSKGFDVQAQFRLFQGLTGSVAVAYTDARQKEDVIGPTPRFTRFVTAGDRLAGAPWNVVLGAQYDFPVWGRNAYVRGDFRYANKYRSGTSFPGSGFRPDSPYTLATDTLNVRAGVAMGAWDLSLFVNNIYNSTDRFGAGNSNGNRSGCATEECTSFTTFSPVTRSSTFTPRTVGLSAAYRY